MSKSSTSDHPATSFGAEELIPTEEEPYDEEPDEEELAFKACC